jgi:hypothetical protein
MLHNSCTHHVQVNIAKALSQMPASFYGGGMITIFPESALSTFANIVFLGGPASDKFKSFRNAVPTPGVVNQQVDVVRGDHVVQDTQIFEPLSGPIEPFDPSSAVPGKLQQEFSFMAAVGNMPDMPWPEMPVGARH